MKKFSAILMAMTLLLSLCACGGGKDETPDIADTTAVVDDNTSEKKEDNNKKKAEKIGSANIGNYLSGNGGGFTYEANDLEGIVSYDGKSNTGAKYYDYNKIGDYYAVQTKQYTDEDDFDSLNSTILIDCFGKEIISEGYCMIDSISNKYVSAAKVVEKVDSKEDADIFLSTDDLPGLSPDEDDILYRAEYYVYDITTGQKIEGVVADDDYIIANGDIIVYRKDGKKITINSKGEALPENAEMIESLGGCYIIEDESSETLYDAFGKSLFVFDSENYCPISRYNGYTLCKNNNTMKIAVFDDTGKMISAEIPYTSDYYTAAFSDDYIFIEENSLKHIYDFEGNLIKEMDGNIDGIVENTEYLVMTNDDNDMVILDTEGNILFEVESDNTYDDYYGLAYREVDDEKYYFCVKDKDFTIKGDCIDDTYYVISENEDDSWEIIDSVTHTTVFEGEGYIDYAVNGSNVYFFVEIEDGVYDFYKI